MDALRAGLKVDEDGKVEGKPFSHSRQWFPDPEHPSNSMHLTKKEHDNLKEYRLDSDIP